VDGIFRQNVFSGNVRTYAIDRKKAPAGVALTAGTQFGSVKQCTVLGIRAVYIRQHGGAPRTYCPAAAEQTK
jgi:hypothetical protein